jgi:hypothetical protein
MQLHVLDRLCAHWASRLLPVIVAALLAGCAAQGGSSLHETTQRPTAQRPTTQLPMTLDEYRQEQLRTLTIRCYMEHREALLRSSSADLRLACREWAAERVAVALGPG